MDEILKTLREEVPEERTERFEAIIGHIDAFCAEHLNDEYRDLSRVMATVACANEPTIRRGKAEGWAAGIVYAVGRVNFLTDDSQSPHMKSEEIAEGFGVSVATMQAKAKIMREGLELMPMHPDWTLPSRMADNLLVWMLEVNGFLMDIRTAPRDAQVAAYEQGLIPYIPADVNEDEGER